VLAFSLIAAATAVAIVYASSGAVTITAITTTPFSLTVSATAVAKAATITTPQEQTTSKIRVIALTTCLAQQLATFVLAHLSNILAIPAYPACLECVHVRHPLNHQNANCMFQPPFTFEDCASVLAELLEVKTLPKLVVRLSSRLLTIWQKPHFSLDQLGHLGTRSFSPRVVHAVVRVPSFAQR
jgi:hypothetical protein